MTSTNNTKLHKEVYGQGEPVVMLHGWAMHTGVWRNFAQSLAEDNLVVCLDLPGHGLSASVSPYTLEAVVDAIVLELPEQACIIVGWSLGGAIALRLAEKYPFRIKSIVLIASNPALLKTESWPGVDPRLLNDFANNLQNKSAQTLLRFMSLQIQGRPDAKSSLKQIKVAIQEREMPSTEVLLDGLAILQTTDQRKTLSRLKIPLLMILGEQDSMVPVSVGEHCQAIQPQIDLKIIAGAGHAPFLTDQKQLLTVMRDFMQRRNA